MRAREFIAAATVSPATRVRAATDDALPAVAMRGLVLNVDSIAKYLSNKVSVTVTDRPDVCKQTLWIFSRPFRTLPAVPPALPALIDVATLDAHLADPSLRVFDATVELPRPAEGGPYTVVSGRPKYERAHIPGAVFADIPGELSDPGSPFAFTLPSPDHFAAAAGRLGIGPGTHVVVYAQSTPMWATRLWWLLGYFGFDAVSVLDGGLTAWQAAGLPVSDEPAVYEPAQFVAAPRPERVARRAEIEQLIGGDAVAEAGTGTDVGVDLGACLVNALTPPVFRGEGISSYSRAGRIPGSVNAPWTELVDPDTFRFRPPEAIERALEAAGVLGPRPVIAYCGGGISATVDLFALSLLGRDDARLYDGSLTEWTADPALPVELG